MERLASPGDHDNNDNNNGGAMVVMCGRTLFALALSEKPHICINIV